MRTALTLLACIGLTAAAADAQVAHIVAAPDSPVRLDSAKVISSAPDPLVLLYAATNVSDSPMEVFTVVVMVFDAEGNLKARQVAPGRRELGVRETKYSAMVLDVGQVSPTDTLMTGVDQAQRAGSDEWWRADLRAVAERTVDERRGATKPPPR